MALHTWISSQSGVELAVAHIDRGHMRCAVAKEALGEAAGGRPEVDGTGRSHSVGEAKDGERRFELLAAAPDWISDHEVG
jgi:hypothetical protein